MSDFVLLDWILLTFDASKQTHQRLRALAKSPKKEGDAASTHTSECSICLMSIAVSYILEAFHELLLTSR